MENGIEEREVIKKQFYIYCPICRHEIKGTSANQVDFNLNKHLEKCKDRK